jgi:hypothetical protein
MILEFIDGSLISSIPIFKQTIKTIIARKILICSPLNLDVYFDPYWAPITPPTSKKIASIKSTVRLKVA